jgi:hemerythrin superfamily protein
VTASTSAINGNDDVIAFLTNQHEQIKALFTRVKDAIGQDREDAFLDLRRLLAVHETAEEEIVHPRAKKELSDGETVIEARLSEEHQAKEALAELEKLDVASPEFAAGLLQLETDVLAHAQAEEQQEFSQLSRELEPEELEKMRTAVERAEAMAPTRPHPGVESAPANMLAGPFAAMLDRARDAMTGKTR